MIKDLIIFFLAISLSKCELKFMVELFRHGARNSVEFNQKN